MDNEGKITNFLGIKQDITTKKILRGETEADLNQGPLD